MFTCFGKLLWKFNKIQCYDVKKNAKTACYVFLTPAKSVFYPSYPLVIASCWISDIKQHFAIDNYKGFMRCVAAATKGIFYPLLRLWWSKTKLWAYPEAKKASKRINKQRIFRWLPRNDWASKNYKFSRENCPKLQSCNECILLSRRAKF